MSKENKPNTEWYRLIKTVTRKRFVRSKRKRKIKILPEEN